MRRAQPVAVSRHTLCGHIPKDGAGELTDDPGLKADAWRLKTFAHRHDRRSGNAPRQLRLAGFECFRALKLIFRGKLARLDVYFAFKPNLFIRRTHGLLGN
jgi:hypothetical protein